MGGQGGSLAGKSGPGRAGAATRLARESSKARDSGQLLRRALAALCRTRGLLPAARNRRGRSAGAWPRTPHHPRWRRKPPVPGRAAERELRTAQFSLEFRGCRRLPCGALEPRATRENTSALNVTRARTCHMLEARHRIMKAPGSNYCRYERPSRRLALSGPVSSQGEGHMFMWPSPNCCRLPPVFTPRSATRSDASRSAGPGACQKPDRQ